MARSVVFETPGHIDIRAFTILGINSKPNTDNPIGYFGTGLKYALSVLLREGCKVEVWIGKDKYTFYTRTARFRDKDFDQIRMKREDMSWLESIIGKPGKPKYEDLPFTTEFGKNWEPWMAYRELESNTRDENGRTFLADDVALSKFPEGTRIVVTGEAFVQAYLSRHTIFLKDGLTERDSDDTLQVFEVPSEWVYWRGMRVHKLDKPAEFTYNILEPLELTEDRTAKYGFMVDACIARYLAEKAPKHQVAQAIRSEGYERHIGYYHASAPSDDFRDAVTEAKGVHGIATHARPLVEKHTPKPKEKVIDEFAQWPRPWSHNSTTVTDRDGKVLFRNIPIGGLTDLIVKTINKGSTPEEEILF